MSQHPCSIRYWPTWSGLGLLWCLSKLPYAWQLAIGHRIGKLFYRFSNRRRHIVATNLSLCFPELTAAAIEDLLQEQFADAATNGKLPGIGELRQAPQQTKSAPGWPIAK